MNNYVITLVFVNGHRKKGQTILTFFSATFDSWGDGDTGPGFTDENVAFYLPLN